MNKAMQRWWAELAIKTEVKNFSHSSKYSNDGSSWERRKGQLNRILFHVGDINQYAIHTGDAALLLNQAAYTHHAQRDYISALPWYQKSLEMGECMLGKENLIVADNLSDLAELYTTQGDYSSAIFIAKRSLEITENLLGIDSTDSRIASRLDDLALFQVEGFDDEDSYSESLSLLWRSIRIKKSLYGECHSDVANGFRLLAMVYGYMGEYDEELSLLQHSLKINMEIYGEYHLSVAQNLRDLADCYTKLQNYSEALTFLRKSLRIRRNLCNKGYFDDIDAQYMRDLAELYDLRGNSAASKVMFKIARDIEDKIYGNEPKDIISRNSQIGKYQKKGEYASALPLSRLVLETTERTFGVSHLEVAFCLNNLASLYISAQGDYGSALSLYSNSLKIREYKLGKINPYYAYSVSNIADLYRELYMYREASQLYMTASKIFIELFGYYHPNYQLMRRNYEDCQRY
jgi:tetratricopeptide (TPR) repeat protein